MISPSVDIRIIDESFYVAGQATALPLIIIATEDEKLQADGVTPAVGTYESGVIRTVTSLRQSFELYGIPNFRQSPTGQPFHGDARNEYGLDALNKFLEVGNRAYVLRANINLNDNIDDLREAWTRKIEEASELLGNLIEDYIEEYNSLNNLVPADSNYKESVTPSELETLVNEALDEVLQSYSFSSDDFQRFFFEDHTVDYPGYQDVLYDTTNGYIQGTDITGLEDDTTTYGFEVSITHASGTDTVQVAVNGEDAQTFADLITEIETDIQSQTSSTSIVELIQGRIRITSDLDGATSEVEILNDGYSGVLPLFANTNLFSQFAEKVDGRGANTLSIYDADYQTITGSYDGLEALINDPGTNGGGTVVGEYTSSEAETLLVSAANDFDNTKEFRNTTSLGANDTQRREEIVDAMQGAVNSNTNIRSDFFLYDLIVAPGFPEMSDELLRLSADVREEAFVIGETPFDKPATGPNGITVWAASNASVGNNRNLAYWYGHGISSNIDGEDILTSSASTALRTIAYNDNVAEPWFAPAGTRRGICPHLTDVGYVSGTLGTPTTFEREYVDEGKRDALYEFPKNINPITFIPGRGILVFGQKTRNPDISALDRINVTRLLNFISRGLRQTLFSFLFEPNDEITRRNVKAVADGFLSDLIDRRALYDFASICDETNNTPERIDRNELWLDIALKPVKAVEFIIVPIRVVRTGADIGGRSGDGFE